MNTQEAAKYLTQKGRISSPEQVSRWAKDGLFQGVQKDEQGRWNISVEALNRFLEGKQSAKRPFYRFKRFWGAFIAFFAFVIMGNVNLVTFLDGVSGAQTQLLDWTCNSVKFGCPFPPEREGETLIVIAHFHSVVSSGNDIHNKIEQAIEKVAQEEPKIENLRVEVDPKTLEAKDRDGAQIIGNRYKASIVIWGEETATNISVNLYNRKQSDLSLSQAVINESNRTQATSVTQPNAYISFVAQEIPAHATFFALFLVALSFDNQDKFNESIFVTEKAINEILAHPAANSILVPKGFESAFFHLARLYQNTGQLDLAIENYNHLIKLRPDYAEAFNNRGTVYYYIKGKLEQAIEDYSQAIKLKPTYADAFNNRGKAYADQGNFDQAIADLDEAIRLKSDYAEAFNNRGNVYATKGNFDQAIKDYNQALIIRPDYSKPFYNRGFAFYSKGDFDKAIADFTKFLEIGIDPILRDKVQKQLDILTK